MRDLDGMAGRGEGEEFLFTEEGSLVWEDERGSGRGWWGWLQKNVMC